MSERNGVMAFIAVVIDGNLRPGPYKGTWLFKKQIPTSLSSNQSWMPSRAEIQT